MAHIEEKLYLQSMFNAIDEVYKFKDQQQQPLSYEERLRASLNKLLVPDWYNHDYTSVNKLRKAKSHGQVPRNRKLYEHKTIDPSILSSNDSSSLNNNNSNIGRHRSPSRCYSERHPQRLYSTISSSDTNGSIIINDRRMNGNHEISPYTSGSKRVAQSSTWYKPKSFITAADNTNGHNHHNTNNHTDNHEHEHSQQTLKLLPQNFNTNHHLHIISENSSDQLSTKKSTTTDSSSNGNVRHPIKPRTMPQVPIPIENFDNTTLHENISLDVSSDCDKTIVQKAVTSRIVDVSSPKNIDSLSHPNIIIDANNNTHQSMMINTLRADASKYVSSDAESPRSAILPLPDKNLLVTDSSSYVSVNEQCLSTTTSSSYHTALADDISSSSITSYETPTPRLNNEILSSHSSLSDLSHAETLEPNAEDLDIAAISKEAQKPTIISPVGVGMESLPTSNVASNNSNPTTLSMNDNSPTHEARPSDSTNWYDEGSIETCIHQASVQSPPVELYEVENDELLQDADLIGSADELLLFSPRNVTDDEPSSSISDDKHEQEIEQMFNSKQIPRFVYTKDNNIDDESSLFDDFYCSSTVDPFGSAMTKTSTMITNLDDILADDYDEHDNDENRFKDTSTYFLNPNSRRPLQEDILYEVEHENSYSDNSQHATSMIMADDNASTSMDPNVDCLTSTEELKETGANPSSNLQTNSSEQPTLFYNTSSTSLPTINDYKTTLPIHIPSSMSTTISQSSSLHVDTSTYSYPYKYQSSVNRCSNFTLSSPTSYTPKIRQRHISVGSYYDNKTTTVAIHPNHTLYLLGSSPVSPLNRTSMTPCDSLYHLHHSPAPYTNVTLNTLRIVSPYIETQPFSPVLTYPQSSPYQQDDDRQYHTHSTSATFQTVEEPIIISQSESVPSVSKVITSSPPTKQSRSEESIKKEEEYDLLPEMNTSTTSPPPLPSVPFETPLVRPKTSRGRMPPSVPPPPPPPRITSIDKEQTQSLNLETESTSTETEKTTTINEDLRFIRGTIKRVLDHRGESTTSESSANYEEIFDDNNNNNNNDHDDHDDDNDNEAASSVHSSKTISQDDQQYPAVEAVQRFYQNKSPPESEKKISPKATTNLDDAPASQNSSVTSHKLYSRSNPANVKNKDRLRLRSNSSDKEQASSEEVDDTLNDIEDDDSQEDKFRRQARRNSSQASNEDSPGNSSDKQTKAKKTSQETQTSRQAANISTTKCATGSQTTIQSYETARSTVPPLDIVTQMVIERNDSMDEGQIGEITGDMIIYYDDIEIVEHLSNISTSESDSMSSSFSKSQDDSKHRDSMPPPIPARALKPTYLRENQQQAPSSNTPTPAEAPAESISKVNRTYELEKSNIRRKFDVNSVNTMMNKTDYFMGPVNAHRHPSARHFAGKLNNDDLSSRNSTQSNTNMVLKTPASPSTTMVKSQTLPLQTINTNGHQTNDVQCSTTKGSYSTLPMRAASSIETTVKSRSPIADTNALVRQIRNSLSRNSLHDSQLNSPLSVSTKDLRTFVSSTYSPTDEKTADDNRVAHGQKQNSIDYDDEQSFKRQARLSKSFHNVSEYSSTDQYPKANKYNITTRTQPSKSVENNLNRVSQIQKRSSQMLANFPPIVASTSISALSPAEDNTRMLSMKWYTGQVSENSEICYNTSHADSDDLLFNYISTHSNKDIQLLLARLQASNDIRIHAALDDVRLRVSQFDASKSVQDLHVFMRYLESRLRDISNKNLSTATLTTKSNPINESNRVTNGTKTNGYHTQPPQQQSDTVSTKSRTSIVSVGKETPPQRQLGRQQLRLSNHKTGGGGGGTNDYQVPPPPRRASQTSVNQENPVVFDNMLNTVLGLPKKGVSTVNSSSLENREKPTPLMQTQTKANPIVFNKTGQEIGKRLFESGTYKDPRLIYDGPRKLEKEEQPLETSV